MSQVIGWRVGVRKVYPSLFLLLKKKFSAIKKNNTMPFAATWMELETLILSEVSQKEKGKYHMVSLISGI